MSFIKQVCWDATDIRKVINPDADAMDASVFLAVHTEHNIEVSGSTISSNSMKAEEFLRNHFLAENQENEVMTVIKGESGSGKSHLIRWMELNIEPNDNRHVITIPKSKTNLKSVLELLIHELPKNLKKDFEEKLHGSMGQLNTKQQKINKLLSDIALSIETSECENETEEYLVEQLPYLFRDPYFSKEFFNESHPVINDLIEHIFGDKGVNARAEKKQEFLKKHLPLNAANAKNAAGPTREILDAISSEEEILESALTLINKNLDKAISFTMSFSPDDLIDLMLEIRREFYKENKTLILLIEDFALLQGVDSALLQALITRSSEHERLCKLRWAMAVTTGYFGKIVDTVKTRITYEVNMDIPWVGNVSQEESYIQKLGATYLNAARIGYESISKWYKEYVDHTDIIPNKCDSCSFKNECFTAFGHVDNVGLYPFNKTAILRMAKLADHDKEDIFRPREFMNKVLLKNLSAEVSNQIKLAEYPSKQLRENFPTNLMNGESIAKLLREDRIDAERRRTLLEIWGGTGEIKNLNAGIHDAFSIPKLDNVNTDELIIIDTSKETEKKPDNIPQKTKIVTPSKPLKEEPTNEEIVDSKLDSIERWAKGGSLRQADAMHFRSLILDAIESNIKWDFLPVAKSMKILERPNIYFLRQETQLNTSKFKLTLPLSGNEEDIPHLHEVLKTLHLFSKNKSFICDMDVLARTQDYIEEMSMYVIKELKDYYKVKNNWDPFSASLELLLLSSVASTAVDPHTGVGNTILINALLEEKPTLHKIAGSYSVLNEIMAIRSSCFELLKQTYTGRKGGVAATTFLDVNLIVQTIDSLKKNNWKLLQDPTQENRKEFDEISKVYTQWKEHYASMISEEKKYRKNWVEKVEDKILIEDIDDKKIKDTINNLKNLAQDIGIQGWRSHELDEKLRLNMHEIKQTFIDAKALGEINDNDISFPELFSVNITTVNGFMQLLVEYEKVLDTIANSLRQRKLSLSDDGVSIDVTINNIYTTLNGIESTLKMILGDTNVA